MAAGRISRVVRAAMFAAVCVPSAAVGHTMVSGTTLPPWMLILTFLSVMAAAWAVAVRERGRLFVTMTAVATQVALHIAFSLGQATAVTAKGSGSLVQQWASVLLCGTSPAMAVSPAMTMSPADTARVVRAAGLGNQLHSPPASMPGMPGATGMPGVAGHTMGPATAAMSHGHSTFGMVAAHLIVAVLCGIWLAYGERTAFRVGRVIATRLAARIRLVLWTPRAPHVPRPRPRHGRTADRPRSLLLCYAIITRGPPIAAAGA